jgi:hypothetical protein
MSRQIPTRAQAPLVPARMVTPAEEHLRGQVVVVLPAAVAAVARLAALPRIALA